MNLILPVAGPMDFYKWKSMLDPRSSFSKELAPWFSLEWLLFLIYIYTKITIAQGDNLLVPVLSVEFGLFCTYCCWCTLSITVFLWWKLHWMVIIIIKHSYYILTCCLNNSNRFFWWELLMCLPRLSSIVKVNGLGHLHKSVLHHEMHP